MNCFLLYSSTYLLHLEFYEGVVLVAIGMQCSKNLLGFLFPIILDEPLDDLVSFVDRLSKNWVVLTRGDSGHNIVTVKTAMGPNTCSREGNLHPQSPGTYRPTTLHND